METKETLGSVATSCAKTRSVQHKGAVRSVLAIIEALELSDEQTLAVIREVAASRGIRLDTQD